MFDPAGARMRVSRKTRPMRCPVRGVKRTLRRSYVRTRAGASAVRHGATVLDDMEHRTERASWTAGFARSDTPAARLPARGAALNPECRDHAKAQAGDLLCALVLCAPEDP
jgi:hypothetical protein